MSNRFHVLAQLFLVELLLDRTAKNLTFFPGQQSVKAVFAGHEYGHELCEHYQ
jgi:hypothetical protein